MQEIAYKNL